MTEVDQGVIPDLGLAEVELFQTRLAAQVGQPGAVDPASAEVEELEGADRRNPSQGRVIERLAHGVDRDDPPKVVLPEHPFQPVGGPVRAGRLAAAQGREPVREEDMSAVRLDFLQRPVLRAGIVEEPGQARPIATIATNTIVKRSEILMRWWCMDLTPNGRDGHTSPDSMIFVQASPGEIQQEKSTGIKSRAD